MDSSIGTFFKDLAAPGALAFLTAFATYLWGKEKLRRERSGTAVTEAQDSEQVELMRTMRERETDALKREREARVLYDAARDELHRQRETLNNELGAMRRIGERRDALMSRQQKQLAALARMVARNASHEVREFLQESGFVALDDESFLPKRKTDPSALPGPVRLSLDNTEPDT